MDKNLLTFIGVTLIFGFVFVAAGNAFLQNTKTPVQITQPTGPQDTPTDIAVINLSASGLNYIPNTITVKQNQKVRLIGDLQSLSGCLKSFVIPEFGVTKIFSQNDNVLEFTPTKKGTFAFSCSMGMGRGTLQVI